MESDGVVQLGSEVLNLLCEPQPDFGKPARELGVTGNALADMPVQTTDAVPELRHQPLVVKIEGVESQSESAADNKVRQIHNLQLEVAKPTNTLVVLGANRITPVTFKVLKNQPFPQPHDWLFDGGDEALIPITLETEPWGVGASVTQALATALATPNIVDVSIDGEVPTLLRLTATRGFSSSGLQTFVAARVPATLDLEDMLLLAHEASAPNWSTFTATSGYTDAADNVLICTAESFRAIIFPVLTRGRYALYAKTRVQSGGKGWLAQCRSGNDPSTASVAVSDKDWRFVRLGDYAADGYSHLRVVGKCRESGAGILVDWVLAVPLDYGSPFYFHCTTQAVASVVAEWLDASLTLTGGGARSALRWVKGPGLKAVGSARLVVAACDAAGAIRRPTVDLSETHEPRYVNWIPAPEV